MFYVFDQNNSHGAFVDPAVFVIVEADTPQQANKRALEAGVYFDDNYFKDCECCGMRWTRAHDDSESFDTVDEAMKAHVSDSDREWAYLDNVALTLIVRDVASVI